MKRWLPLPCILLLVLLITWPMASDPAGLVLGHPQASAGCHVWVLWWASDHITELHTPLIFFPYGADVVQLYGSDVLGPLLLGRLPLAPAALHNLWVALLLLLGGWGTWQLCLQRGASLWGAMLGSTVWVSAPFFQHETLNGTTELLAAGALPWLALTLLRLLARPTLARGALVGLVTGLAVAASAYNLFFAALLGACILAIHLARGEQLHARATLPAASAAAAVLACFAVPLAWLHRSHGATEVYARREQWMALELDLPDSYASLLDWVDPGATPIPFDMTYPDGSTFEYWTTSTVYLGLVALGLAVLALARRRGDALFLVLLLVGALVSMGAWLRLDSEPLFLFGQAIPLPAQALAALFPPFVITAVHSYRYAALAVLGLAVLASLALRRPWLALPALALVLVDAVLRSPVPWPAAHIPLEPSPVLEQLAAAPDGAVLVAPIEREHLGDLSLTLLTQTRHGKPIHDGGIHRRAGPEATLLFQSNEVVDGLSTYGEPRVADPESTEQSLEQLRRLEYRYLLVRATAYPTLQWATSSLGAPAGVDSSWALWEL